MKKTALGMDPPHMLPKTASKSEVPLKSYFWHKQVWQTYIYIYIYIPRQLEPPGYVQTKLAPLRFASFFSAANAKNRMQFRQTVDELCQKQKKT